MLAGEAQDISVASCQLVTLCAAASFPNWAYGMDDVACRKSESRRNAGLPGRASNTGPHFRDATTCFQQFGPGGAVNRTVDSAAAEQPFIGSVDDCVDRKCRYVD